MIDAAPSSSGGSMTAYRAHRHKALSLIVDFLDKNYPCDCPRTDPCGSNTAEAIEIVQTVLEAVAADIWDEGYDACVGEVSICTNWNTDTPNPYRASETT